LHEMVMGPVPDLDRMANTAFDQIATMWRVTQCVDFGADRSGFAPYQDTSIRVIDTKDIGWSYTEPPDTPIAMVFALELQAKAFGAPVPSGINVPLTLRVGGDSAKKAVIIRAI